MRANSDSSGEHRKN
jgi:DNA repair exonuclease SbcCD ATPase subunit